MSDEIPLLRTIMDAPNDVEPRLIFADWLEERGDPWAELIRLQCEMAPQYANQDPYDRLLTGTETIYERVSRCETLLRDLVPNIVARLELNASGTTDEPQSVIGNWDSDYIAHPFWRKTHRNDPIETSLFFWRGFPERIHTSLRAWNANNDYFMKTFPINHLSLSGIHDLISFKAELVSLERYIGKRITALQLAQWPIRDSLFPKDTGVLKQWGELAAKNAGKPFTLILNDVRITGNPDVVKDAWKAHCQQWLEKRNIRMIALGGVNKPGTEPRASFGPTTRIRIPAC